MMMMMMMMMMTVRPSFLVLCDATNNYDTKAPEMFDLIVLLLLKA
jgi:hypothetical protein